MQGRTEPFTAPRLRGFLLTQWAAVAAAAAAAAAQIQGLPAGHTLGRGVGRLLQINLTLTLLLPARNSLWNRLVGLTFERCQPRSHRPPLS